MTFGSRIYFDALFGLLQTASADDAVGFGKRSDSLLERFGVLLQKFGRSFRLTGNRTHQGKDVEDSVVQFADQQVLVSFLLLQLQGRIFNRVP